MGAVAAALATAGTPAPATAALVGGLSGRVTGDGAPLANVWVTLTPVSETGEATGNPTRTLTDGSGRYAFPQVQDPAVKIHVRAPLLGDFVDTWWPGVHTRAQAQVIEVSDSPVTADVRLPVGGSVSGRVVDSVTGDPLPDAQVSALIAETEKGFGFPGAGSNAAHNLPLGGNPHTDAAMRGLSVALTLAGGYARELGDIVAIHSATVEEGLAAYA